MSWVEAVVFHTGYGKLLSKGIVDKDFPYLDVSAAVLLVRHKTLRVVGLDSLSVDMPGDSKIHQILFSNGRVLLLESLTNLEKLPLSFTLCCMPLLLDNSDGAPCRTIALC